MSFLDQLKSQAYALQSQRAVQDRQSEETLARTEQACRVVLSYLQELARQLSIIEPAGPEFSVDGHTPWPAMKLTQFRVDSRRKRLRNREVFDYVVIGWQIVPQVGQPVSASVSVNFPKDMQRVEDRLAMGPVQHGRVEVRDPQKSVLKEVRYEYLTQTRGSVTGAADHDSGQLHFRLLNTAGFGVEH